VKINAWEMLMARLEDTLGQKHANIRIACAGGPTGVLQPELAGETLDYYQQVRVNDG